MEEKKEQIMLSCLITNYNQIEWIGEAVDSILRQTIDYPYEILIGDDGSNDGSLELIQEKYGQLPQVRILVQERKPGKKEFSNWRHSRLIFRLLDEAKGKYVSFLDGDDYFCDKYHFQHKIELLEQEENQDCSACYGNMYKLIDGKTELYTSVPYGRGKYEWLKDSIYIHLAAGVIRKSVLANVPRDIYYEQFVDWEITMWAAKKGKIYYVPTPCFVYRILPNSIFHGASSDLHALRQVLICDANYQAYGGKEIDAYRLRKSNVLRLYRKCRFSEDIDCAMWSEFAQKYHAKVAYMLLNREQLKIGERVWLAIFCFRLSEPWKTLCMRLKGYGIGIGQLLDPKVSREEKKALVVNWWKRSTKQNAR
jgi:glycosyltransferase involved in cell wall biosynthesis